MSLEKWKTYRMTKFSPDVLGAAVSAFSSTIDGELRRTGSDVFIGDEGWAFDNDADFFSAYRNPKVWHAIFGFADQNNRIRMVFRDDDTTVSVSAKDRTGVERVFEVIEAHAAASRLPEDKRDEALRRWLKIFIGHGRNPQWRDVKDHLADKHGFKVIAYESGARAGLHITEILKDAQRKSGFAILVMTAENKDVDEVMHARENVIHEIGLFQGKLGTSRAIVLLEDDCVPFSNLAGVQYIPFSKDNIKETFGEVLATIRREFGPKDD